MFKVGDIITPKEKLHGYLNIGDVFEVVKVGGRSDIDPMLTVIKVGESREQNWKASRFKPVNDTMYLIDGKE